MKKYYLGLVVFGLFWGSHIVWADRGSIPFNPAAIIFEPGQWAMLAWDGHEEILILATDMRASQATRVLQVLPLPTEPRVKKGDIAVFNRALSFASNEVKHYLGATVSSRSTRGGGSPAGEVTFHETIGAHDITVAHVRKPDEFVQWVDRYLTQFQRAQIQIPAPLAQVITEYLQDGFSWFVFDVIDLDDIPKTNEAIFYQFQSEFLYYPLRITRTEHGETTIRLFVVTPQRLQGVPDKSYTDIKMLQEPVYLSGSQLSFIDHDIAALLQYQGRNSLRIWEIQDTLSSFDKDLLGQF